MKQPAGPVPQVGLGYRPPGYKPNAADYAEYKAARELFLRGPRGRVALMRGGILWRLGIETLGVDVVLAGPTDDVHQQAAPGMIYCDDELTADEEELICGVYLVYTGKLVVQVAKHNTYCFVGQGVE